MEFRFFILSMACVGSLVPPAHSKPFTAVAAIGAAKGAALLGAKALATKAIIAKGLIMKGIAAAAVAKGAAIKGGALLAAKGAAVKLPAILAAKKGIVQAVANGTRPSNEAKPPVHSDVIVEEVVPVYYNPYVPPVVKVGPPAPAPNLLRDLTTGVASSVKGVVQNKVQTVGNIITSLKPTQQQSAPIIRAEPVYEIVPPGFYQIPVLQDSIC